MRNVLLWPDRAKHFSLDFISWCKDNIYDSLAPVGELTDFAVAISEDMNCRKRVENFNDLSSIDKYRFYYKHDKEFAKWTKRQRPNWY